jgi:hypothetical protein
MIAERDSPVKLEGVRVTLNHAPFVPGLEDPARSDATGKLVFPRPIAPGRYSIHVETRSLPEGCHVQKIKLGGEEISGDDFEILTSTVLEIILSSTAGAVAGSVTDAEGAPFPEAAVTLISPDGKSQPVRVRADADGHFRIPNLRPAKYQLLAWEEVDDAYWQDPAFRKPYESRAVEVTIEPKATQTVQPRLITVEELK